MIAQPRQMKYLICKTLVGGWPVPLVFPEEVTHAIMAIAAEKSGMGVVSAGYLDRVPISRGFFGIGERWEWRVVDPMVRGAASSNIRPGKHDQRMLQLFFEFGLSGEGLLRMLEMEIKRGM